MSDLNTVTLNVVEVCAILCALFGTLAFIPFCLLSLRNTLSRLAPPRRKYSDSEYKDYVPEKQPGKRLAVVPRKVEPRTTSPMPEPEPEPELEIECGSCGQVIRSGFVGTRIDGEPGAIGQEVMLFDCEHCGSRVEIAD